MTAYCCDITQDPFFQVCELPLGHEGPHQSLSGSVQWTSLDEVDS